MDRFSTRTVVYEADGTNRHHSALNARMTEKLSASDRSMQSLDWTGGLSVIVLSRAYANLFMQYFVFLIDYWHPNITVSPHKAL